MVNECLNSTINVVSGFGWFWRWVIRGRIEACVMVGGMIVLIGYVEYVSHYVDPVNILCKVFVLHIDHVNLSSRSSHSNVIFFTICLSSVGQRFVKRFKQKIIVLFVFWPTM